MKERYKIPFHPGTNTFYQEPVPPPNCRRMPDCPYASHAFVCWDGQGKCLYERVIGPISEEKQTEAKE